MTDLAELGVEELRKMVKRLWGEIEGLKRRKKFGLVWEDKLEEVVAQCERELPVLEEVKGLAVYADTDDAPTNLLIEGDNYHALSVLNYTHAGKIDVIYIDPPYNTGKAKEWRYNDLHIDENDGYRHSKWLSMMAKRLTLAKNLLTEKGVIFVSIDDNEQHRLRMLMDEIFGENNFINLVAVIANLKGNNSDNFFSGIHEYGLVYAKCKSASVLFNHFADNDDWENWQEDEKGLWKKGGILSATQGKTGKNSKTNFPVYVSKDDKVSPVRHNKTDIELHPTSKGKATRWYWSRDTFVQMKGDILVVRNEGKISLYKKQRMGVADIPQAIPKSVMYQPSYGQGGADLEKVMGKNNSFPNPKSVSFVKDVLHMFTDKNSIVLDFFAGSGTTGHAVSVLNKKDNGNRHFILCTNNEGRIASEVCQPRIKAVIEGGEDLADLTGIPSNLKYFKTDFVVSSTNPTDWDKRRLTEKAADMLCVREGTFNLVEDKPYRLYSDGRKRFTGIIYNSVSIGTFKKIAAKLDGKISVYVFSLGDEDFSAEFADLENKVEVRPIPEVILGVYREIFRKGTK